jgi:nucleoside-diphosphate-sugar epimerase
MRVVVTGASGFIGQKLCGALLERGHVVIALCRTSSHAEFTQSDSYMHIPYVMGESLPESLVTFLPEALIHLAWDGIPDFSERKCVENLEAQIKFFSQTEKLVHLKKIIGAGTCREYSTNQGICVENEHSRPDSFFSWAKRTLSEYLWVFCQQRQIALVWFRIFYVYGPGQRSESLIPMLIRAYKSNIAPNIKNATAANDYIYIDDVVMAFVKAIEDQDCQGTFNLGSGIATTVAKIAAIVEQIVAVDNQLLLDPKLEQEKGESSIGMTADITLSTRQFNCSPKIDLFEGIRRTIGGTV